MTNMYPVDEPPLPQARTYSKYESLWRQRLDTVLQNPGQWFKIGPYSRSTSWHAVVHRYKDEYPIQDIKCQTSHDDNPVLELRNYYFYICYDPHD